MIPIHDGDLRGIRNDANDENDFLFLKCNYDHF